MRIACTREIACSPDHLWPYLKEPEKQKLWMKGLESNQTISEQPGVVGSTFRMKIREGRKLVDIDGTITAHDPPKRLAVDLTGGSLPAGAVMHVDYQMKDLDGRTQLDYLAELACARPLPWWMRLLMPLISVFGRMQLNRFLNTLQRLAEQPA